MVVDGVVDEVETVGVVNVDDISVFVHVDVVTRRRGHILWRVVIENARSGCCVAQGSSRGSG